MSPESPERNDTPPKITHLSEILKVACTQRKELLKETLQSALAQGIPIENISDYQKIIKLLKESQIIDITSSFDDLNDMGAFANKDINKFALKRVNPSDDFLTVFLVVSLSSYSVGVGPFHQLGIIDKSGKYSKNMTREVSYVPSKNPIVIDIESLGDCTPTKKPKQKRPGRPAQRKKPTETTRIEEQTYTVKPGDTLWKIVRNLSGLYENTPENRTKIANTILEILHKNPHIKDEDKIFIGQKIIFSRKSNPAEKK